MMSALKRLVVLVLTLGMSAFLIWGYLQHNGLAKALKEPLVTPFLTVVPPHTIDRVLYHPFGAPSVDYYTADRLKSLASQAPNDALWLDVQPRADGSIVVGMRQEDTSASVTLKEALALTGDRRLVLNFSGFRPGVLDELARVIDAAKAVPRILMQSPEDGFMKDAREAQPTWLFGTSQTQVTLLIMMTSIGLESQSPLRSDVFVMEGSGPRPLMRLSDAMITEVHRRRRKVYVGPVSDSELPALSQRGVDGALVLPSKP